MNEVKQKRESNARPVKMGKGKSGGRTGKKRTEEGRSGNRPPRRKGGKAEKL